MSSFTWMHVTDLHVGMPGYDRYWPQARDMFYRDLEALHRESLGGFLDCVFFTGDLAYSGTEFEKVKETLDHMWSFLSGLNRGRTPVVFAVPGNHDMCFPPESPSLHGLESWRANDRVREMFWSPPSSGYRQLLDGAFSGYMRWLDDLCSRQGVELQTGIVPGDFAATVEKDGFSIGVVGLNTAFMQLRRGSYKGRIILALEQLNAVCRRDVPDWVNRHTVRFLLTHHPPDWLDAASRAELNAEIAPAGRFHVHLFGHMHESFSKTMATSGSDPRRFWQGASLFGLRQYGSTEGQRERIHGYGAGKLDLGRATIRLWPRVVQCRSQGPRMEANPDYTLERDGGTHPERIEIVRPGGRRGWPSSGLVQSQAPTAKKPVVWPDLGSVSPARDYFDLADLLQQVVVELNDRVGGDGCSLFLYDEDVDRFVLRESTIMTPFIGKYALDRKRSVDEEGCGITTRAAERGESRLIADVSEDPYWSFRADKASSAPVPSAEHCELPAADLHSMIVIALSDAEKRVKGVLRVVRKRDPAKGSFRDTDFKAVIDFVNGFARAILGTLSLGQLLDAGAARPEAELCSEVVRLLADLVRAKGCSLFLLDEALADEGRFVYRCQGTTGLRDDGREPVYRLPEESTSYVTAFAAHAKRNVVIPDVRQFDFASLGLTRGPGSGKTAESVPGNYKIATGPMMVTPLLYRERFDARTPALGVLRVTKPEGLGEFDAGEQRRVFAFAERLSRTLLEYRHQALLDDLVSGDAKLDDVCRKVVRRLPRLVGGRGCSVFTGRDRLVMRASLGPLEGRSISYDLSGPATRGVTGAAAVLKREILWNNEGERRRWEAEEGVRWSGRGESEIDESPARFLATPILAGQQSVGVIRIPKTAAESPFSWTDVKVVRSVANQLGRLLASRLDE